MSLSESLCSGGNPPGTCFCGSKARHGVINNKFSAKGPEALKQFAPSDYVSHVTDVLPRPRLHNASL